MTPPIWVTDKGSIGLFPSNEPMEKVFIANPVLPAVSVTYKVISGDLPESIKLTADGLLYGIPPIIGVTTTYTFVIRATDNYENVADRTFTMIVGGIASPTFTTDPGLLNKYVDSTWVEFQIEYNNPVPTNKIRIRVVQGILPPGLEINDTGLIRGYPNPPLLPVNFATLNTFATATSSTDNSITIESTVPIVIGRTVQFSGTALGGINTLQTYYVREILSATKFTISDTEGGPEVLLTTSAGFMFVTFPQITVGQPATRQYNFTLQLESELGNPLQNYSIVIKNHYLPTAQGGPDPANPPTSRLPVIVNTRPQTYDIENSPFYDYYSIPPDQGGATYPPSTAAPIGLFLSDNYFAFKVLGVDFDNSDIGYSYGELPYGLTGDANTGWIKGTPIIPVGIDEFEFTVTCYKIAFPGLTSGVYKFKFKVSNEIIGDIIWITDDDLGTVLNGSTSLLKVEAISDVPLKYRLANSSTLPPNIRLLSNGEITGKIAWQPKNDFQPPNNTNTFTFEIEAYNEDYAIITSTKQFTLNVYQEYNIPTDDVYIKCTPSIEDRNLIRSLLDDAELIPEEYLFRPEDSNFGKAKDVIYQHAYGIHASSLPQYLAALEKNHFWRNIVLGPIKTAQARNEDNEILYEVVYSEVVDDLINPEGQSIDDVIIWPRNINLNEGPWYTSITNIYTSYIFPTPQELLTNKSLRSILTQAGIPLLTEQGSPTFYTSLSPGTARILYPNSLVNMRNREEEILGVDLAYRLLPAWMTSQQSNGSTLGFTAAWVIAYTKPGTTIKVEATATNEASNSIICDSTDGFEINRPIKFYGSTLGGIIPNMTYYIKSIESDISFTISEIKGGDTFELLNAIGSMDCEVFVTSYADIVKDNIENNWVDLSGNKKKLNQINFQLDRITVDKSTTYDYDSELSPPSWLEYPSATPPPDPKDSKDFYVLFPRKTILPSRNQY